MRGSRKIRPGGRPSPPIPTEFSSSEDGDHFIEPLENLGTIFLDFCPKIGIIPSLIDNMLVVLNKDTTAVVYINEVRMMTMSLLKRPVVAGPISFIDDLAALVSVKFDGIEVPDDSGVVYLFSLGWRGGRSSTSGHEQRDTHKGIRSRRDAGVVLRASQAPIGMEALRSGLGQGDRSPMVPIRCVEV